MLDCFLAAPCTCNDSNLCKSSSISFPTFKNYVINSFVITVPYFFLLFDECSSIAKCPDLFLTHVEMGFLGTPKPDISKLFTLSFRLTEDILLPELCWEKERTNFRAKFCRCNY